MACTVHTHMGYGGRACPSTFLVDVFKVLQSSMASVCLLGRLSMFRNNASIFTPSQPIHTERSFAGFAKFKRLVLLHCPAPLSLETDSASPTVYSNRVLML
jgi:hypothetical protein